MKAISSRNALKKAIIAISLTLLGIILFAVTTFLLIHFFCPIVLPTE